MFRRIAIGLLQCLALAVWMPACYSQSAAVLIIDDMGNSLALGERALALPGDINFSFLPRTPNSRKLAQLAHDQGKEVLVHLPMSNLNSAPTGPGKLSPAMDRHQFAQTLNDNLKSVPHAKGVNNHMGSLLTQLHQPMQWLMDELKFHQLYFIDSRTSPLTVAEQTAVSRHVPVMRRDIFLDNDLDPQKITQQFERWIQLTKKRGIAVAIAHPHPQTMSVLERLLPGLKQRGVHLVFASQALQQRFASNTRPYSPQDNTPATANN